jgi:hypothetical protein
VIPASWKWSRPWTNTAVINEAATISNTQAAYTLAVPRGVGGEGYHCEDGGYGRADSRAESEETGEEGEDCEGNGDQEEGKHDSRGVIEKVLIRCEIHGNGAGTIEVYRRIEWVSSMMGSTVDVFPISRGSTNSPERPLSKAWATSV